MKVLRYQGRPWGCAAGAPAQGPQSRRGPQIRSYTVYILNIVIKLKVNVLSASPVGWVGFFQICWQLSLGFETQSLRVYVFFFSSTHIFHGSHHFPLTFLIHSSHHVSKTSPSQPVRLCSKPKAKHSSHNLFV